jgi:F-type H+-transporting ATPase subunit a
VKAALATPSSGRAGLPRVRLRRRPNAFASHGARLKRALVAATTLALVLPPAALARGEFHPEKEFELNDWVPIHIGALNLSINKAVVYLWIGAIVTMLLGIFLMRSRLAQLPGRRQTVGEAVYEVAQTQVAEQGLPSKAIGRWFPYVASLMLFIWVVNILGFIPLPISNEKWHGVPTWGIYAATANLSVTLALAILTWLFTHYEGIRWNGPVRYFKSWIPPVPRAMLVPIAIIEVIGQFMRLISLSVRLFANMLAGHMLILVFIGLMFVLESYALIPTVLFATIFYVFEVVIVVSIQAYIFAALSAIYIGSAIEPEH